MAVRLGHEFQPGAQIDRLGVRRDRIDVLPEPILDRKPDAKEDSRRRDVGELFRSRGERFRIFALRGEYGDVDKLAPDAFGEIRDRIDGDQNGDAGRRRFPL